LIWAGTNVIGRSVLTGKGREAILEFAGELETHITVDITDPAGIETLWLWAEREGYAFHHIVLDRGRTPSQPMVSRRGVGQLSRELDLATALKRQLAVSGFAVSRIKIEAAPENEDVPLSDAEAADHKGRYFEHHVKLALDSTVDMAAIAAVAVQHSAHLSRNARRVRADGLQERFVTQRCFAVGRDTARERLEVLLVALRARGYPVVSVEEEFVAYDSTPGVDAGWLQPIEASP
jgi:hypothetical protein